MNVKNVIDCFGALAISCVLVGCSCAKQKDLDELRREVDAVSFRASQSKSIAEEANARSLETKEALDRSFQKSMRK